MASPVCRGPACRSIVEGQRLPKTKWWFLVVTMGGTTPRYTPQKSNMNTQQKLRYVWRIPYLFRRSPSFWVSMLVFGGYHILINRKFYSCLDDCPLHENHESCTSHCVRMSRCETCPGLWCWDHDTISVVQSGQIKMGGLLKVEAPGFYRWDSFTYSSYTYT